MNHNKIAIIAVAYNRIESLKRLLTSLSKANYEGYLNIPLIISIDKSDSDVVERFADEFEWKYGDKIVDKHSNNLGLRTHMMSLGKWFDSYNALVVLEDDIIVAKDYYNYANQVVSKYCEDSRIAGASLYSFKLNYQNNLPFEAIYDGNDVFFMSCAMSWGEIWMKEQWMEFYEWYLEHLDFPIMAHLPQRLCMMGKNSWLKYHTRYCIESNKFFVYPYHSLSTNFSDAGTHNNGANYSQFQVPLSLRKGGSYRLPEFSEDVVKYDGFFENTSLYDALGINKEDLCLDLNGTIQETDKKFWLTTQIKDYKIVAYFNDDLRPLELNVLLKQNGTRSSIFLYDTSQKKENRLKTNVYLYRYYLGDMISFLHRYGKKNLLLDYLKYFLKRLKL